MQYFKLLTVNLCIFCAIVSSITAQNAEPTPPLYYVSDSGGILTEEEYRKGLQRQIEILQKINKQVIVEENRSEVFYRNDSAMVTFRWEFFMGSLAQNEKLKAQEAEFASLKGKPFPFEKMAAPANWKPGKPALINLWFMACPPCIAEMPVLNMMKEKYGDRVQFLSILPEPAEKLVPFLQKHDFLFTHHPGERKFLRAISAVSFPKNILLDQNGVVVATWKGVPMDESPDLEDAREFMDALDALLEDKTK